MIIDKDQDGSKLDFFKDLYERAKTAMQELYDDLDRHWAQYKGSKDIDGSIVQASYVRNITYELIESQVTSYLPTPNVTARVVSDRNERNAKAIETLLRSKRNELPFESLNDMDERYNPIYGGSVWLVEWDESIVTPTTAGDVKISCLSPRHFCGQPGIFDVADMEYCFVTFETTKEDICRRYDVEWAKADEAESDTRSEDDNTATLYVCYYKDEDEHICQYVWSGDIELLDIEDYYARKTKVCKKCGQKEQLCKCDKPKLESFSEEEEEIGRDIALSDGSILPAMSVVIGDDGMPVMETRREPVRAMDGAVAQEAEGGVYLPLMTDVPVPKMEPTVIPFYRIKTFPIVIRKNTSEEDNLLGQSDCAFIRPQQQAINKIESRIIEKLMESGVFPIVPEDFTDELDNSINKRVFRASESNFRLFSRMDLSVDISRDVAMADRIYDHAKRILGITDSFQGQHDASAQSGRAKQIQVQQAAGRLDSKRQMKNAAYAEIDRLIFLYYLAFSDEPRTATYKDSDGRWQNVRFSRYDFVERDKDGTYYYNDQYLFSADSSADVERQRDALWQANLQNYQAGTYGNPQDLRSLLMYWQTMERLHYPFAADNVERIRLLIQEQAQMAQLQAQNAALAKEVENRAGYAGYLAAKLDSLGGNR